MALATPVLCSVLLACAPGPAVAVEASELERPVVVRGRAGADAPWTGEVALPAGADEVLVELAGAEPGGLDLDLAVGERRSASHLARERLLVAAPSAGALPVRVTAAPSVSGAGGFRLAITPLAASAPLAPGERWTGEVPANGRRLLPLVAAEAVRVRLRLEGAGELDLVVCDPARDAVELSRAAGGAESCLVDLSADAFFRALLLNAGDAPAAATVVLDRPGKGVKSFRRSRLDQFLDDLAQTPAQREAISALRRHPDYLRIRYYLERYPGGIPIRLRVVPGLRARGVERFGTYSRGTLTINPTIPGHRENVQELMDTLVHELVHALLALPRASGFPLGDDVLDAAHDPRLRPLRGRALVRGAVPDPYGAYLERSYGPSASNPERDYTDINAGAQRLIVKVIEANLARTGLGHETLVFENVRARRAADEAEVR